ncbi:hypothetical protein HFP15_35625 [Amycolatopsis sp. K13G38]|uniref:Uncharacterized protein n=1 Tax=Amycolatopsis acididurans TaxID=2724524 RepID=A0ABX1JEH1_9PSEU|nr:hypothetical protein [Amycolatopsis acididurans]NKQ58197.1 hypothetical protein [Amycolatopsis acididurans]
MTRTILHGRSSDLLSEVRIADRTGIVAASAPPAAEPDDVTEALPVPFFELPPLPAKPRRVRRTVLFTCAAALFLVVGWIGGGTFGQSDPVPAAASAPAPDRDDLPGGAGGPATTSVPSAPPAPAAPAPVDKTVTATKRVTVRPQAPVSSDNAAQARSESVAPSTAAPANPIDAVNQQVQQALDLWAQVNTAHRDSTPRLGR